MEKKKRKKTQQEKKNTNHPLAETCSEEVLA